MTHQPQQMTIGNAKYGTFVIMSERHPMRKASNPTDIVYASPGDILKVGRKLDIPKSLNGFVSVKFESDHYFIFCYALVVLL